MDVWGSSLNIVFAEVGDSKMPHLIIIHLNVKYYHAHIDRISANEIFKS